MCCCGYANAEVSVPVSYNARTWKPSIQKEPASMGPRPEVENDDRQAETRLCKAAAFKYFKTFK